MNQDISIRSLEYDLIQGKVRVELEGLMGGRSVTLQVQFAFRADDVPEAELKRVAILETQQILRAASNVTLQG